jgi:O-antigen/teichoic acid export membrane protein
MINKYKSLLSRKISRDILSILSGRIFTSGLYFLFTLVLMSVMTVGEYGKYTYYYSIIVTIPFILDLGTSDAFIALGAKKLSISVKQYNIYKNNYLFIKYSLLVIFIFIITLMYFFNLISSYMLLLLLFGLAISVQELFSNLLAVKKNFKLLFYLMPIRNFIAIITLIIIGYSLKITDTGAIVIIGFSSFMASIIYVYVVGHYQVKTKTLSKVICIDFFKYSGWLIIYSFATIIMTRLEIFVLEYYANHNIININELGYFSAAFSFAFILSLVTSSIVRVMLPNVSSIRYIDEYQKYIKNIKKLIFPVFLSVTGIIILISIFIYLFLYEKYEHSVIVFIIISLATIMTFFTNLLMTLFYVSKKTHIIAKIGFYQLLIVIFFDLSLIYYFGSIGAALSMLIVRIAGLILVIKYLNNIYDYFENRGLI